MEKTVAIGSIGSLTKQRNLFLILTILSSISLADLSLKLVTAEEKVILVPGLNQEVWTSHSGVSRSYLEETTLMYLPLLLDLNPEIIDYKAGVIFRYISQDDPAYMRKIQEYFASSKAKYAKFALSTYFSAKNLEIDSKSLTVIANGTLSSRYGDRGFQADPTSYKLSYTWMGERLRLKEFVRVRTEKEIEQEKEEQQRQESLREEELRKLKEEEEEMRQSGKLKEAEE